MGKQLRYRIAIVYFGLLIAGAVVVWAINKRLERNERQAAIDVQGAAFRIGMLEGRMSATEELVLPTPPVEHTDETDAPAPD